LKLLPDYNRILDANRGLPAHELSKADLEKVMLAVGASAHLYRRWLGSDVRAILLRIALDSVANRLLRASKKSAI
jgi:hypothetical protein